MGTQQQSRWQTMLCIFSHISAFRFRQQHPFLGQSHFYAFHFVVFRWILKINVLRNLLYRITCPSVWYVSGRIFFSARHRAKTKFNFYANDRSSWILFKKRLNAVEYAIANKVAFCFVFFCVCKYGMNWEFWCRRRNQLVAWTIFDCYKQT